MAQLKLHCKTRQWHTAEPNNLAQLLACDGETSMRAACQLPDDELAGRANANRLKTSGRVSDFQLPACTCEICETLWSKAVAKMQPSNNIVAQDFRDDDAVHLQHAEI